MHITVIWPYFNWRSQLLHLQSLLNQYVWLLAIPTVIFLKINTWEVAQWQAGEVTICLILSFQNFLFHANFLHATKWLAGRKFQNWPNALLCTAIKFLIKYVTHSQCRSSTYLVHICLPVFLIFRFLALR